MRTAEELRRRMNTATDIYDIVKTMKSLAAVNIAHYEAAVESINEYYRTVLLGLQALMQYGPARVTGRTSHRKKAGQEGGDGIVVFGSDQGMCGGFNDRIVDFTARQTAEAGKTRDVKHIICVGLRAAALLEAEGLAPEHAYAVPSSLGAIVPSAENILADINVWLETGAVERIVLFHNRLSSGVTYDQERKLLLPLSREWYDDITARSWPTRNVPVFTMDHNKLFSALVRQYLFVSLYRAFAESMATENSARLASMQAAEKNIEERLQNLTMEHRQQRQMSITSELLDIVSGFEALK